MPINDLINLGAPAEIIEQMQSKEEAQAFEVWPEHWDVMHLFLRCSTQWVVSSAGDIVGLNYSGVKVLLDLEFRENQKDVFFDLQVIEMQVIKTMRERKK